MSDKPWKASERAIAAYIGGVRVPITGRARGATPDIAHPWLVPEVKRVEKFPHWLAEAYEQALAAHLTLVAQDGRERLPVVIVHPHRTCVEKCYVLMSLADLMRLRHV